MAARARKLDKSVHSEGQSAFSKLMIEARKSARLTQHEVAKRLHKPQSFIAKYEGGERRIDVVEFVTVCQAIGADPAKTSESADQGDRRGVRLSTDINGSETTRGRQIQLARKIFPCHRK